MLNDSQWQQLAELFLSEAQDLMVGAERALQVLETDLTDHDAVNELFRAIHTLKGSAGLLGLDRLVAFAHEFETMLVKVRDRQLELDQPLLRICYRALDHLSDQLGSLSEESVDDSVSEASERLRVEMSALSASDSSGQGPIRSIGEDPERMATDARRQAWHISLRFDPDLFVNGFDPASFVRYLTRLGTLTEVIPLVCGLPDGLGDFDPEQCFLGLEINLVGETSKEAIEEVFEFIRELSSLRILPPESRMEDYISLIRALPEDDRRLGEILVQVGLLTERELAESLGLQEQRSGEAKLGEVIVEENMVAPEAVQEALDKQKVIRESRHETSYLKIASQKMDALINQVGELVVAAAGTRLAAASSNQQELMERAETMCSQVELIRESALALRMVEIRETFGRFHRVVREASEELGKSIRLEIRGGETELDKTLVDRIYDPLVHLVRNAIDHGIEAPDRRALAGKPQQGQIVLNAYHDSGTVVIEVEDDGQGIDVEKVRMKAIDRGIISADQDLDEQAFLALIFEPGFSTAEAVTNLSGRGVGMDSVRQSVEKLRGIIDIENQLGTGCRFRIRLPLTLAIIDGFLVSIADQYLVIPLEQVTECIEAPQSLLSGKRTGCLDLRGSVLPFVDLHHHFALKDSSGGRPSLVIVQQGHQRSGLLVDELHGEIQTVIKPLGSIFERLPGIGGAAILASGEVALMLDIAGVLQLINQQYVGSGGPANQMVH